MSEKSAVGLSHGRLGWNKLAGCRNIFILSSQQERESAGERKKGRDRVNLYHAKYFPIKTMNPKENTVLLQFKPEPSRGICVLRQVNLWVPRLPSSSPPSPDFFLLLHWLGLTMSHRHHTETATKVVTVRISSRQNLATNQESPTFTIKRDISFAPSSANVTQLKPRSIIMHLGESDEDLRLGGFSQLSFSLCEFKGKSQCTCYLKAIK